MCFFVSRAANPLVFHNLTKLSDYITHSVRRFSLQPNMCHQKTIERRMKDEDVTLLLLQVKTWENSWEKPCSRSCVLWFIIENNESQIMVSKYAGRCLSFLFFACYTCYDVCVCHSCNETSRWLAQIVTHCVENWFWWSANDSLHTHHKFNVARVHVLMKPTASLIAKMSDEPGQLVFLWLENTNSFCI
jgi:hypothetical protein